MRRIELVFLLLVCACATRRPIDPTGQRIDDYLRRASGFGFDGQVLVEKDGRVLLDETYGFADRERGKRTEHTTTYGIASQSKQFTAAAILALEAEDKLRVEDTIGRFLDDVPADKKDITIDQLLSHTSGLPPGDVVSDFARIDTKELIHQVLAQKREKTGTWQYSNAGYNLLAAIIERVSGMSYETYLRKTLFAPARMRDTGVIGIDHPKNGAIAYRGLIPQRSVSVWPRNVRTWGGGDLFSTVDDLYRWELALRDKQRAKLFTPRVKIEGDDQYAYGWFVGKTKRGTTLIEHGGDTELGFNCAFKRFPDEHATILLLSNRTEVNGPWLRWLVQDGIETILFGGDAPALPRITKGTLPKRGTYRADDGSVIAIRATGDQAIVSAESQPAATLLFGNAADAASLIKATKKTEQLLSGADRRRAFEVALTSEGAQYADDYLGELAQIEKEKGALLGFDLIGSVVRRNTAKTFVTLHLENGDEPMTYTWRDKGEGRLGGSSRGEGPPLARIFAATGEHELSAVHLGTGAVITMKLDGDRIVIGDVVFTPSPSQSGRLEL